MAWACVSKKFSVAHSLSQLSQVRFERCVDLVQTCIKFFLARLGSAGSNHQLVAIGTDFQRSVRCDLQHFKDGFVDNQRQAVSVFDEHLLHNDRLLCLDNSIHEVYTSPALGQA